MARPRNRLRNRDGYNLLTTGEAARLSGLSQNTIIRSIDRGILIAHRIPGSRHRRIERTALRAWMRSAGIPIPKALEFHP